MPSDFLVYGSTGFVGDAVTRLALKQGLKPMIAGRNAAKVKAQAAELGLEHRVIGLDDSNALDQALKQVKLVLHCAGPYFHTYKSIADACLRTGAHYLDLTGEMPVYQALAAMDSQAKAKNVMLLPGVGFDVVPTDCLALHLKNRLPSATHLALAWRSQGPSKLPPGTVNTMLEGIPRDRGILARQNGQLQTVAPGKTRIVDFGAGPEKATRWTWGDVFTAYYSTGIPNIETYTVLPDQVFQFMKMLGTLRPLFKLAAVRRLFRGMIPAGSTADERAKSKVDVWGEAADDQGRTALSRLHGPEAGVDWTALAALATVKTVLAGDAPPGFQTPAMANGADFVLECPGVTREDIN